jgi:dTMP kinase
MKNKGLFVTFEGCEGCGKSIQARNVDNRLIKEGYSTIRIREPGSTPLGEELRNLLKNRDYKMSFRAELLLMNASRAQLVEEIITPALASGNIVLCDRFYDSTRAYQGYGREISLSEVDSAIQIACGQLKPDLTFLIDRSIEESLTAAKERGDEKCRFEAEEINFHRKVYDGFQKMAQADNDGRFVVIPFLKDKPEEMTNRIVRSMEEYIKRNKIFLK